MSRLLHLHNRLKAEARPELLTNSQHAVVATIGKYWQMPERVNLVGPRGTGKTFIGWTLTRVEGAVFFASPQIVKGVDVRGDCPLIIDNVSVEERSLRSLIAELQLLNVRKALLISADENRLGLPIVRLEYPTQDDIDVVYHNLSLLEYYALTPLVEGTLWQIIYSTLNNFQRRGTS